MDIAVNGKEAVEKATSASYDVILMDIMMPVMNGLDAARAIRAAGVAIPIIALSANAFTEDRETSLAAGMNEHLTKPIKVKELLDCIAKFGDAR